MILNLVNSKVGDNQGEFFDFKISKFPDGQQDVTIIKKDYQGHVLIKSRLRDFKDLEIIICSTKALRRLGYKELSLYIPYLLGSRSDRDFTEGNGGTSYLVDVVAPILNSLNFERITVIDVHSDVASACIKNLQVITNKSLVDFFLEDKACGIHYTKLHKHFLILSPDAGALKKIYKISDNIGYKGEVVVCSKFRDTNGNLSKVQVPISPYTDKDIVIIDDICDGGATFINIAKVIKDTEGFNGRIYLIVTHGIFSRGFSELRKYFDVVYCTNSYSENPHKYSHNWEENVILTEENQYFVKQLNVY